jgi:hypothetical protein
MNQHEEELQKAIEKGIHAASDDINAKAYQHVFDTLKKEPQYQVPANFAEHVALKIQKKNSPGFTNDMFWFGVGIFLTIVTGAIAIAYTGFKPDLGFLKGLADFKGLLVFGAAFIIFLNWLDKKLLRKSTSADNLS